MLRASAQTTGTDVALSGVLGDVEGAAVGIEHGALLLGIAEGVASRDYDKLADVRARLEATAGSAVVVDAVGVAANFQRMVRIADSIGIPVDDRNLQPSEDLRANLKLNEFSSARNTPGR